MLQPLCSHIEALILDSSSFFHIFGRHYSISIFIKHFLSVLKISKTFVFFSRTPGESFTSYGQKSRFQLSKNGCDILLKLCNMFCVPESFNTITSHYFFYHKTTLVNSIHNTNSKGDFLLKTSLNVWFKDFWYTKINLNHILVWLIQLISITG